jgi:hypothetical protein
MHFPAIEDEEVLSPRGKFFPLIRYWEMVLVIWTMYIYGGHCALSAVPREPICLLLQITQYGEKAIVVFICWGIGGGIALELIAQTRDLCRRTFNVLNGELQ